MGVINVLDFKIANLIAAGEVVERPASAVKELIENSIDAKSTEITVEIKRGGVSFIRVSDNGCGMSAEDMPVAIKRHATSKISSAADLDGIMTLGFRGEALAAIASVSQMRIISKRKEDAYGTLLTADAGKVVDICETGSKNGTTVIVEELFANVPARRKFLKKDAFEGAAVVSVAQKIALSHPDIAFKLINNGSLEFSTPGDGRVDKCIYAVLGREFASKMINVNYMADRIEVYGYIGRPDNVRANRNYQNFYINNRYVRSKTATAALEQAFDTYLEAGKFPCSVLYINIHPTFVDVNVHPTKLEVKFSNEKAVFEAIYCAVKNAILSCTDRPEILFEKQHMQPEDHSLYNAFVPVYDRIADTESKKISRDKLFEVPTITDGVLSCSSDQFGPSEKFEEENTKEPDKEKRDFDARQDSNILSFDFPANDKGYVNPFYRDGNEERKTDINRSEPSSSAQERDAILNEDSTVNTIGDGEAKQTPILFSLADINDSRPCPRYRILGEAFRTYISVECDKTVLIIDKHAAHERILFEQMKKIMKAQRGAGQILLFPIHLELCAEEYSVLWDYVTQIKDAGFRVEKGDDDRTVYITQIPMGMSENDAKDMLVSMVGSLADSTGSVDTAKDRFFEKALYQASCKAATKAGWKDDEQEIRRIVEIILKNPEIRYCPHGRPVAVEISQGEIEKIFKRT